MIKLTCYVDECILEEDRPIKHEGSENKDVSCD